MSEVRDATQVLAPGWDSRHLCGMRFDCVRVEGRRGRSVCVITVLYVLLKHMKCMNVMLLQYIWQYNQ